MKIKNLEILGFKSFVDRSVFNFREGVTVIVGPNGCGKSNVVDAIRWCLGEQSARRLRGDGMEDVLFNGSDGRKPLGMAEVSLVFSNGDGDFPTAYSDCSEIMVTRRAFRSGESEFFINKTPCRLKDITDLFLDTGIGKRVYSIVEQGRIEEIVNCKPEDRRVLIEEVAGIMKYKQRKREAIRKMEATKENLLRVNDLLGELSRQVNSLKRQASKARRYQAYREEIRDIELSLAVEKYQGLKENFAQSHKEFEGMQEQEVSVSALVSSEELKIEEMKLKLVEDEKVLKSIQEQHNLVKTTIQRKEDQREFKIKEVERIKGQTHRDNEERDKIALAMKKMGEEIRVLEDEEKGFNDELSLKLSELEKKEESLARAVEEQSALGERIEEEKASLIDLLTELAHQKNSLLNCEQKQEELGRRITANQEENEKVSLRLKEIAESYHGLKENLEGLKKSRNELEEEKESLVKLISELRQKKAGIEDLNRTISEKINQNRSRLQSLEELEENFEGYREGVRSVMLAKKSGDKLDGGIKGLVVDVMETEPRYERALEAILTDRLQHIIVEHHDEALRAIAYLKGQSAGRCTFIPLELRIPDSYRPGMAAENGLSGGEAEGIVAPLLNLVKIKPDYQTVGDYLLNDVTVVTDLDRALNLWRDQRLSGTLVTLEGEVVNTSGVISGGSLHSLDRGILAKRREIKELSQSLKDDEDKVILVRREDERLGREITECEQRLEELKEKAYQQGIKIVDAEKDYCQVQEEQEKERARQEVLEFTIEQLNSDYTRLTEEIGNATRRKEELERLNGSKEEFLESARQKLSGCREVVQNLGKEVTELKVETTSLREKLVGITNTRQSSIQRKEELSSEYERIGEEILRGEREIGLIDSEVAGLQEDLDELLRLDREFQGSLAGEMDRFAEKGNELKNQEEILRELRKEHEQIQEKLGAQNLKVTELRLKLQHLEESIEDKYHLKLPEIVSQFAESNPPEEGWEQRLEVLRNKISLLGEVNLIASKEYEELEGRYKFLSGQKEDLERSLDSLQKTINRINRTSRERFRETFELVNEKFKAIFPKLFEGGRAELLLNEDDVLEAGVDLVVQPPGKKLQNVSLLSGGEKAMGAIALIFALLSIKPAPFCLLDEADAPLDDFNINRFSRFIKELSQDSQFILITHNKRTMEIADSLCGVTMEEAGVTKLVSVKLN
ncbi:MAG: chromosome segregation protein SMC [Deltaproteobacteria bacterium]|nr:MAG: chromosome segregation protein SMC [Deltaproteobacteria bacterium]